MQMLFSLPVHRVCRVQLEPLLTQARLRFTVRFRLSGLWKLACLLILLLSLNACLRPSKPTFAEPFPLPEHWQAQHPRSDLSPDGWVKQLRSKELETLVAEALSANRDLKATAARLEADSWSTLSALSRTSPELNLRLNANRRAGERRPGAANSFVSFSSTLAAAWEPDLWGRLRRQNRADAAEHIAQAWDYRGAKLSLAVRTAQAWMNTQSAQAQTQLANKLLKSNEEDLQSINLAFDLGVDASALDLRLAENSIAASRARLSRNQRELAENQRALEVLLGRYPKAALTPSARLLAPPQSLPSRLPLELLGRRPDLVAARLRALAQLDRAEAEAINWLPNINLSASAGRNSDKIADWFDFPNLTRQIAASLAQPLLDGGQLKGEREAARARAQAAIEDYAQTLLDAMLEVENALAAERFLQQELASQTQATQTAQEALELARENYAAGLSQATQLFDAQRRLINAEISQLQLQNQRWQNRLSLYLALGGAP